MFEKGYVPAARTNQRMSSGTTRIKLKYLMPPTKARLTGILSASVRLSIQEI